MEIVRRVAAPQANAPTPAMAARSMSAAFGVLYGFALWCTSRDPQMLQILLRSGGLRARYDAAKHDRVDIVCEAWRWSK